jgi:hypothetical protein
LGIDFAFPEDFERLALGVVVEAGEAGEGVIAWESGRDDLVDEPTAAADVNDLALGEVCHERGSEGAHACSRSGM